MTVKGLIDEDFVNFKLPSLFICFPKCDFKCERDCGQLVCQNRTLLRDPNYEISYEDIYARYRSNPISEAIVCGGLEPFDTFDELYDLIRYFRENGCQDPFVIYTGYEETEIKSQLNKIKEYSNIIVKFGRFVPDSGFYIDPILQVKIGTNQYAKEL